MTRDDLWFWSPALLGIAIAAVLVITYLIGFKSGQRDTIGRFCESTAIQYSHAEVCNL